VNGHGSGEEHSFHLECDEANALSFPLRVNNSDSLRGYCEESCELDREEGLSGDWKENLGAAWGLVFAASGSTSVKRYLVVV